MTEIENEMRLGAEMIDYFARNIDKLPAAVQLQFATEYMKFIEHIKPLYAITLALRGDRKEEKIDD